LVPLDKIVNRTIEKINKQGNARYLEREREGKAPRLGSGEIATETRTMNTTHPGMVAFMALTN
jgi:hypothetical protein